MAAEGGLIKVQGAGSGLTCGRSDGEVSCMFAAAAPDRAVEGSATGARASAAEATAARVAAGVPSTRRGSRGRVTVNVEPAPLSVIEHDRQRTGPEEPAVDVHLGEALTELADRGAR